MEISAWNSWLQKVDNSAPEQLERELAELEHASGLPFVERNLRLGYLYFLQDALGAATGAFRRVASAVSREGSDPAFVRENRDGLRILQMGWKIVEDGCGGFELRETGCGGAGPFCCCAGILVAMGICGINFGNITNCGGSGEPGCLDNFMNSCFSGCGTCCNCGWFE